MNKTVIESKIESLIALMEKLKDILKEREKSKSMQEFLLYAAEKKAEESVELAISINQELLKSKGKISPSYYDSFMDLAAFNVFSEAELRELAGTAGFRNRLAHEYLDVDEKIAVRSMERMLKTYPVYLQKIKKIISR